MANFDIAPRIVFSMNLQSGHSELLIGRIECIGTDGSGLIFPATSGLPGNQGILDARVPNRGPIPIRTDWTVATTPEPREDKGIEGEFFRIHPVAVKLGDVERGGFGIHRDANAPGSAGCIVILDRLHFAQFSAWILAQSKQFNMIKLEVQYA